MDVLAQVLASSPPAVTNLRQWWSATASARASVPRTIDRALLGGALADRVGYAFASGYAEALRFLVPDLDGITALCATEDAGNHPRSIRTTLAKHGDRFTLTGKKKWATAASEASSLLVVASIGEDAGRNHLRVVRVPVSSPNLTIRSSAAPFVPEIEHAEIDLDGVPISASQILPGDGYDDYLKPFRTIEDLHVHAALVGYLIGVARRHSFPATTIESLLALATTTRAIADADLRASTTHLVLAGLLELVTRLVADIETAWSAAPDDEYQRWQRDRALLQVAGKARHARRENARTALLASR